MKSIDELAGNLSFTTAKTGEERLIEQQRLDPSLTPQPGAEIFERDFERLRTQAVDPPRIPLDLAELARIVV